MNTPQTCWRSSASKLRGGVWGEQVGRVCMWVEYGVSKWVEYACGWSTGGQVGRVWVGKWVEYACGWSTGGQVGGVWVGKWVEYGVGNWVEYGWARERSMRYVGGVVSHLHIVTLLCRYCHSLCH